MNHAIFVWWMWNEIQNGGKNILENEEGRMKMNLQKLHAQKIKWRLIIEYFN